MAPDLAGQRTLDGSSSRTACPPTLGRTHARLRTNRTLASARPYVGHKLGIAGLITGRSRPSALVPPARLGVPRITSKISFEFDSRHPLHNTKPARGWSPSPYGQREAAKRRPE
jgi:hypothetical protein